MSPLASYSFELTEWDKKGRKYYSCIYLCVLIVCFFLLMLAHLHNSHVMWTLKNKNIVRKWNNIASHRTEINNFDDYESVIKHKYYLQNNCAIDGRVDASSENT